MGGKTCCGRTEISGRRDAAPATRSDQDEGQNVLLGRVARMTISRDVRSDCPSSFDRCSCRALPGFGTIHSEAYRAHNSLPLLRCTLALVLEIQGRALG